MVKKKKKKVAERPSHKGGALGSSGGRRRHDALPAGIGMSLPVVAIVGRPNVGKSTLFNRLAGGRIAIVEDMPGVTRDRHYADTQIRGREVVLIDTGGFDPESEDPMAVGIAAQVELALEEADVLICVLDASADPLPADREAVALLRRADKPIVYVANKSDSPKQAHAANVHYTLGVDHILPISAQHGLGMPDLERAVHALLPAASADPIELPEDLRRLAIVGRPNAGKSSLANRLLGEERQLVDARPGTTVDSIDAFFQHGGQDYVLIDTAGIRRKRIVRKVRGVEGLAVMKAVRAMERSDVVVMMIDAHEGVAEQDARLLGLAVDRGRACVVGLNKADLMSAEERKKAIERATEILSFAPWAAIVPLSAKTGRGVGTLMKAVEKALREHRKRVGTAELNRFFEEVLERNPPPTHRGRAPRIYYITQARNRPPTFVAVSNAPEHFHFSYQRYLVNQLRDRFGFHSTPIRVLYRQKRRRGDEESG